MMDNGIPRENIIHLSYDDVANNRRNPYKGQLFNKPVPTLESEAELANYNVYDANRIDYSGKEVNKENFFKVLLGDDSASGPVLKSDAESRVFIYYVDHGGVGLICTPESSSRDWIYADELDDTLKTMKDNGMFKELVFYLETCESGSMFPNVSSDEGVYAMTASNASQSSWGAYCGTQATVDGVSIGSCLGDLFSINWM
jgi:legumain